jgi:two-component system LytT family response regulator
MKSVIVDDNELAIRSLEGLLKHFCAQVTVSGRAQTIKNAVALINELKPEIVFLDVEMNNETGFDLFSFFPKPEFIVVFTTSHEKYAVKAFKTDCFDYLVKPIDAAELVNSINRIEKELSNLLNLQRNQVTLGNSEQKGTESKKIAFISNKGYSFVDEANVVYFNADGKYTKILTDKKEIFTSSKNIGEIEPTLSDNFFRCHKSWIINLKYVSSFNKDSDQVILLDGVKIDVSSRKKEEFLKLFTKL